MFYASGLLEALIEVRQRSTEHPSVHGFLGMAEMYGSKKLVYSSRCVCSPFLCLVVRDSRMWCPHDIGRDSWVWGEQGALYTIHSPHEVGEEALTDVSSLSGENGVARG